MPVEEEGLAQLTEQKGSIHSQTLRKDFHLLSGFLELED